MEKITTPAEAMEAAEAVPRPGSNVEPGDQAVLPPPGLLVAVAEEIVTMAGMVGDLGPAVAAAVAVEEIHTEAAAAATINTRVATMPLATLLRGSRKARLLHHLQAAAVMDTPRATRTLRHHLQEWAATLQALHLLHHLRVKDHPLHL